MDGELQQIVLDIHTSQISTSACKLTDDVAFLSWHIVKTRAPQSSAGRRSCYSNTDCKYCQ